MANAYGFSIPNPEDFAGSPLLDDDEDEGPSLSLGSLAGRSEASDSLHARRREPATPPSQTVVAAPGAPRVRVGREAAPAVLAEQGHRGSNASTDELEDERTALDQNSSAGRSVDLGVANSVKTSEQPRRRKATPRESRFELTEEHLSILTWMDKARYTSNEQVAVFMDRDLGWSRKMLQRLTDHGYVARKAYPGAPTGLYLTPAAKDLLESETGAVKANTGPGLIRHTLDVGWAMLAFLKREARLTEWAEGKLGRPVQLSDFISEAEVERAVNARHRDLMAALQRKENANPAGKLPRRISDWEAWAQMASEVKRESRAPVRLEPHRLAAYVSPEADQSPLRSMEAPRKPHVPDLVLLLSEGEHLAIEVERSYKPKSLRTMFHAYDDLSATPYAKCLWLCGSEDVMALVKSFADEVKRAAPRMASNGKGSAGVHGGQLLVDAKRWKVSYLAGLEADAEAVRAANATAREGGHWHRISGGEVLPCRCGVACQARYGRVPAPVPA